VATLQLQTLLKIILSLLAAPLPGEPSDVDICKVHFGLILAEGLSIFKDSRKVERFQRSQNQFNFGGCFTLHSGTVQTFQE